MLMGYMARESLGTPELDYSKHQLVSMRKVEYKGSNSFLIRYAVEDIDQCF